MLRGGSGDLERRGTVRRVRSAGAIGDGRCLTVRRVRSAGATGAMSTVCECDGYACGMGAVCTGAILRSLVAR